MPIFILLTSVISVLIINTQQVSAATSSTLNFQGRLLTNTGGLVPDGSYNIEFKIYDDPTAGTNFWTEARTGGSAVTVKNGYFSVYLGEVTPFGGSIPWDQELYMTMNVNSDGEMTPRFKLTAVPYAFRAGAVTDASGNAFTGDDLIQKAPASAQAINSALAAIRLNQTGSGSLLQLQGDGVDIFTVSKIGETVIGRGLTLGTSTSTTAGTIRWTGADFEGYDGSTWKTLTSAGVASATDYVSVTTNANSTASAAEYDVFQSSSYGTYSSTTNAIDGFVYTPTDGRFTAAEDGTYNITANYLLETSTSGLSNLNIKVNGVNVYSNDIYVHASVDPVERSVSLIRDLTAGDYVEVFVDALAGNVTTHGGTTLNIVPVSTAGAGGGGGGAVNAFEQSGNSFGSTAILGTTDSNGLQIITNTAPALEFTAGGAATFYNGVDVDGLLNVNNGLDVTSGNLDLSGGDITGAGTVTVSTISGDGFGLTGLDGDKITAGTIADARLSSNISKLNTANDFTDVQTFTGGSVLGNFLSTTAGAVRWTGTDFEGYDGVQWVSFTSGGTLATPAAATFYDSTGGATIASGVFSTINLDATLENSDGTVLSLAGDEVTISEDGYYEVSYQVTARLNSGTRSGFNAKLQRDAGSGFGDVPGTQAYHYGRITSETAGTSAASIVLNLSAGDVIRIQGQGTTQSFTTIADSTSLTVVRVTNGSGGGGGGGGLSFEQNGNSFGATAILGTTDNNGLRFVTNNLNALEFTSAGVSTFSQVLQASNGIDITSGGLDLSGGDIIGVDNLTATTFSGSFAGDGSAITGLTNLDGDEITTGTISSARLDSDVALLNANQTFTGIPTFDSGLIVGGSTSTTAGTIRWSGSDFEGFNGVTWASLTGAPAPPSGGPSSVGPFTFDADGDADETAWIFDSPQGPGLLATGNNGYWNHATTDTPSSNIGPTSGQGGSPDGYIYTESSSPGAFSDIFTVTLDDVIDASAADWIVDFYWNQRGDDNLATVQVQTNEASAGWVTRGTYATGGPDVATSGAQQWNQESLDLAGVVSDASTEVRFLVTLGATGTSWNNDFGLDTITLISSADSGGSTEPQFVQGGNAFGTAGILGTTDTNGLSIITNNAAAIIVSDTGNSTFVNNVNVNGKLTLGTPPTVDINAQAQFFTGSSTGKGLVLQGAISQSANIFELQDNAGVVSSSFNNTGNILTLGNLGTQNGVLGINNQTNSVTTFLAATVATSTRIINLPDESGTICLSTSSSCGFLSLATGSFTVDATTNDSLAINKTGASGNLLALQKNGGAVFTVSNTGALQIQNSSSTALDIRNTGGTSYFSVDTTTGIVRVGPAAADANGVLFVLDTKNTVGDPTGTDGGLYYNSSLGKFRCYESGAWKDCIGTRQVRSFVDTVTNAVVDSNTTNYWNTGAENNNSYPNITPSTNTKSVTGSVVVQVNSTSTADRSVVFRVERSIGTIANCGSGTTVGTRPSTFTTNNGDIATSTIVFVDSPATTSQTFYRICSDTATSSAVGVTVDTLRVTLEEANNSN